mmetsp:Transcript_53221/g.87465  ORF Transcript_53221/g.87465 Transcript_53221/m.87465 type:complete len:81 (+) Transcript_53221:183-425(+)
MVAASLAKHDLYTFLPQEDVKIPVPPSSPPGIKRGFGKSVVDFALCMQCTCTSGDGDQLARLRRHASPGTQKALRWVANC